MSTSLQPYFGYADGASHNTHDLSSIAWATYDSNGELVSLQRICMSCSTNKIAEYNTMIELLFDAISHGICYIVIILDS